MVMVCSCSKEQKTLSVSQRFPARFSSSGAANEYLKQSPTRGRIDRVRIGMKFFLVVFTHGSGVPVTGIAIYERHLWAWELVADVPPPGMGFMRAAALDGKIVAISERLAKTWTLFDPGEKKD